MTTNQRRAPMASFRVCDLDAEGRPVTGIDYSGGRAEPGEVIKDLSASDAEWLAEQGYIEPVKPGRKKG